MVIGTYFKPLNISWHCDNYECITNVSMGENVMSKSVFNTTNL